MFLEDSIEETEKKFRPSHLRAVRKAVENKIIVKESPDIDAFYIILKNNLKTRHGATPTHTPEN